MHRKMYLLGAVCAAVSLALLAGCGRLAAGSSESGSGSGSGSASPVLPAVPANVTAEWTEDAVSHGDTAPAKAEDGASGMHIGTDSAVA